MYASPIEIKASETKTADKAQNKRSSSSYTKKKSRKKLPREMEESALTALKEMLARQKRITDADHAMSAAGPFSDKITLQQLAAQTSGVNKIDPSAQVMQLFEKLIDSMLFLDKKGIQETTFFLDGDAFSSSIFSGAKITITEYSTAPKVFNIQFSANPEALSFFNAHASDLSRVFQKGNYNFSVHRLEGELLEKKPLIASVERDLDKEENHQ